MSDSKVKPRPEDRLITMLEMIRLRLVEAIAEIDKEIGWYELIKKRGKK